MRKRILSLILALTLCASLLPVGALASEEPEAEDAVETPAEEPAEPAKEEPAEPAKEEPVEAEETAAAAPAEQAEPNDPEEETPTDEEPVETEPPAPEPENPAEEEAPAETEETAAENAAGAEITASGTCGADGDNLTWTLDSDGVLTISGTGDMVEDYLFDDAPWYDQKSSIVTVVVEDGVTSIGDGAFYGCYYLTSVTIPDSVTSIGRWAFEACKSLTSVTIPDSVTSIGYNAFNDCTRLTAFEVGAGNTKYTSANGVLYNTNKTELIKYPAGKTYAYFIIPDSVTSIGDDAFSGCSSLTSVTIPSSVTSIGNSAFSSCTALKNVTIPDSVTSIGDYAFDDCMSLTSVTIPDSVTSIGEDAFSGCTALKNVTIPDSVTIIRFGAFSGCSSLTSVTIPNGVWFIGINAFYGCRSLTSVTIPDSVTGIGNYAFEYCSSLTSVTIPDSVTDIGDYAFEYCSSLTSVTIGNSVTSIGHDAFYHCTSLTSVTIPGSVTNIGHDAFCGCTNLTDVYYSGSESDWAAISIDSSNGPLTGATIHYNSTGDEWEIHVMWPKSLSFDEGTAVSCDVGQTVNITAVSVSSKTIELSDVTWTMDNEIVAVAGTEILGPTVTGEEDTYWISTAVTGLATGSATLTLSVGDRSASVPVTVNQAGTADLPGTVVQPGTMGIGVLTGIDENLNQIFIDEENAYTAAASDVARMKELLKNKKISDKRVIFKYTEYNVITSVYSVYDVLCLQATNVQASPGTLEYGTDGAYQTDTIDITADVYVAVDISADAVRPYTDGEIESLGKENLYLDTSDIALTVKRTSNIIYFGKTLWVKSAEKDVEIGGTTIGYGSGNKISVAVSADVDDGEEPEEASASVRLAKFFATIAGKEREVSSSDCKAEVINVCEAEKENELAKLLKSYENANIDIILNSNLRYADGSSIGTNDMEVMKYIVKMLELEAIASLEDGNADNWAERLGNIAAYKLESALLSKLGLSSDMIGGSETIYVYASYTGATGQTAYLKIPVCIYTLGGTTYGAFNAIYYSTDNKNWQQAGGITYYNMGAFADCMISYVKMAYNEAWGKSVNKAAEYIVGQPLTDLFNTFKAVNLGASVLGLNVKLPRSVSDGIFEFCLRQTKKCVSVKCPVDVYVYNSAGQLCGAIENNEINPYFSDENVVCSVAGDEKYVTLYSDNYSILLVGNDTGTMEYQIDEYEGDELVRSVKTVDIPLEDGIVYCGSVPQSLYTSAEIYELVGDGEDEIIPVTSDEYYGEAQNDSPTSDTDEPETPDTGDNGDNDNPGSGSDPDSGDGQGTNPGDVLLGDVNGDGKVNAKDVTVLFQYVNKQKDAMPNMNAGDVNGDGTVNAKDVTRLFQYANKQIEKL